VRASRSARLETVRCVSAFLQGDRGLAGEQLAQFELVLGEVASGPPTRVKLRLPTTSPWTRRGTTMMF